jgi:hypothetical protein
MDTQVTFILSILSLVVFCFIVWIIALIHAATNKNFKDSNQKLIWVLIIIFTNGIGAILYLLFGRPKEEKVVTELSRIKKLFNSFGVMPLGLKILTLLSIYYLVDTTLNLGGLFNEMNFLGIELGQPLSSLYNIGLFTINIIFLVSLFRRYLWGWKVYMVTQVAMILAYFIFKVPVTIKAIFSPASEIYKIINLTTTAEYQNPTSYGATKFVTISTNILMLVVMLLITAYLYKKRNYFNK